MDDEVLLKLSIAEQSLHHANFAGTVRQAVADGYSAIDAALSALLLHDGNDPPRNHKSKFDLARQKYPGAFADWDNLEAFYHEWLASRYDSGHVKRGRDTTC